MAQHHNDNRSSLSRSHGITSRAAHAKTRRHEDAERVPQVIVFVPSSLRVFDSPRSGNRGRRCSVTAEIIRLCLAAAAVGLCQMRFSFHNPRLNNTALTTASDEYATASAMKTPCGPRPARDDRYHASGISHIQNTTTLITIGVQVSPAPLKACVSTI